MKTLPILWILLLMESANPSIAQTLKQEKSVNELRRQIEEKESYIEANKVKLRALEADYTHLEINFADYSTRRDRINAEQARYLSEVNSLRPQLKAEERQLKNLKPLKQIVKKRMWRCNYKHALHDDPSQCSKPQLGGQWINAE